MSLHFTPLRIGMHQAGHVVSDPASARAWLITLAGLSVIIIFDFILAFRNRHVISSLKTVVRWTIFYVCTAIAFGASMGLWTTSRARSEFFAGWVTEYSLSFDNLFVLLLVMKSLQIARERQDTILFGGVISSLFLRGIFILGGVALVNRYVWIFYIFGGFLIFTGIKLFFESEHEEWHEGPLLRFARKRGVSIGAVALIAVASTNLIFAFDSIPAIFGLTHNLYIIVTATIFASMGLRQLFFLIGDLMDRLIYLSEGLSLILGFIGLKLVFEAALGQGYTKVLGVAIPNISLGVSLCFVLGTLAVTAVVSLVKSGKERS